MISFFLNTIVFLAGLFLGSFLNFVIYRMENDLPLFKKKPFCSLCNHRLRWFDLIPILSFVVSKGKCSYCKKKISFQYPLVELLTGGVFAFVFNNFPFFNLDNLIFLFYFLIVSLFLIVIFVFDLKHYIIPDKVVFPLIGIAFLFNLFFSFYRWDFSFFLNGLLSAFFASLFFLGLFLFSKGEWFGLGDVKLIFFMGLLLGSPSILVALFSAHLIGAIMGVGLMSLKKKGLKSEIPFAPFLIIGTYLGLFYGEKIVFWYLSIL